MEGPSEKSPIVCMFSESERQAIVAGLYLLMGYRGFSDDYGNSMSINEIDDLISEILNA